MSKKVHTSKADFKLFKQTCLYYLELFGVTEYEIEFRHRELTSNVLALTRYWTSREDHKMLTFELAINWDGVKITPEEIENTAFHEVLHAFLARLNNLSCERFCNEKDIDEEIHILINRIMRAFSTK